MDQAHGIGPSANACLDREMLLHVSSISFASIYKLLLPSLFRHKEKKLVLCSHVDDLLVGGEREAVQWLVAALKSKLTLQGGDLIPAEDQDDQDPVRFLKKRRYFTQAGVIISPHEKYADELVQLYGLQHRKQKTTPDVSGEIYESEELDGQGKHRFRSAMGTLLYLSQDRVDYPTLGPTSQPIHVQTDSGSRRSCEACNPLPQGHSQLWRTAGLQPFQQEQAQ
jgi:hypothetical protein